MKQSIEHTDRIKGIRKRIRESIRGTGVSVNDFCAAHFMDSHSMYNNKAYPSIITVLTVSEECNVTTDYILWGK